MNERWNGWLNLDKLEWKKWTTGWMNGWIGRMDKMKWNEWKSWTSGKLLTKKCLDNLFLIAKERLVDWWEYGYCIGKNYRITKWE